MPCFSQNDSFSDYKPKNFKVTDRAKRDKSGIGESMKCMLKICGDPDHSECVRRIMKEAFDQPINDMEDLINLTGRLPPDQCK